MPVTTGSTTILVAVVKGKDVTKESINAAMKKKNPAGKVVLKNTTMCGLFAPWSGAGSLLEINLEKDVELPVEYIWSCTPDLPGNRTGWWYGVDETYGLVGSAWTRGGIRKICI